MTGEMREDGHEPATRRELRDVCTRLDGHDRRFEGIEANLRRLNIGFARMEGNMTEMQGKIDILLVLKEEVSRFSINLERVANHFESSVRKMDLQGSMLMDHEGRITKLESRLS